MDNQVKITLTSLNGDVYPPQRFLYLNPDRSAISMGRASKTASKGLLGAPDNAWFDSPVMSRYHAKLIFDPDRKNIVIEDIGSMHGTFLNDALIPSKTSKLVADNDEIKFGAEVKRGPETFPACRFRVNYEFDTYKRANTYEFPDYSDVDEDEDCFSDDEVDTKEQTSSEDGISNSQVPSSPPASDPIDLTGDDSPKPSNLIDLTEDTPVETAAELNIMTLMAGRPADISDRADATSIALFAGNPMTLQEPSDDEDAHFSPSSNSDDLMDQSDSSDSEEDADHDDIEEMLDEDMDEGKQSEDEDESDTNSEESDSFDFNYSVGDIEQGKRSLITDRSFKNPLHEFAHATHDNTTVLLSEPQTATNFGANDDTDDDGDESDIGLDAAGAEGIRVLSDGGLIQKDTVEARFSAANFAMIHPIEPAKFVTSANVSFQANHQQQAVRQPSPSDAAMVKAQPNTNSPAVSDTVQSLGEMTGKSAFFEAREVNKLKLKFVSGGLKVPGESSTDSSVLRNSTLLPLRDSTALPLPSVNPMMQHRTICNFLDKPDTTPLPTHAPAPLPDMTSAATYAIDKIRLTSIPTYVPAPLPDMASASAPAIHKNKISTILTSEPRVLKIPELCGEMPTPCPTKRKAEDISDYSEEEIRLWAKNTHVQEATVHDHATTPNIESSRPTKRFRKFMENVGYAAIGGVAVGATLFTALVATAPNFA